MNMARNILLLSLAGILSASITACGDEEHEDDDREKGRRFSSLDVAPVDNAMYAEECGSCHFAYQPGLLPARSWQKMMAELDDHFGENAELDSSPQMALTDYLMNNAAEHSSYKRSRKILSSIASGETPLRITETRYFKRKHHELSRPMVQGNPKVGSFSACAACHVNADKGSYNEHEINIPGYGRWDD
jgi:hypothetical protein